MSNHGWMDEGEAKMKAAKPKVGDYWEFKLPGKRKRVKEVGSIGKRAFLLEQGTYPKWEDKIEMLDYIWWARANKGRYTGITVRRLLEFGKRVSTKAERDAHRQGQIEKAQAKRLATNPTTPARQEDEG